MRPTTLLAAAAATLVLAACDAGAATAPSTHRLPPAPAADGTGTFGSGGATPAPPDSTRP